jgi:hypothetical protein
MFNRSFKAKVGTVVLDTRKQKGNNEDERTMKVTLHYQFDSVMAAEIGGDAPGVQKMLANGGSKADHAKLKGGGLRLHCKDVSVKFRLGNQVHSIEHTIGLSAKCVEPLAKGTDPTLEVSVTFLPSKKDLQMVWDNQGSILGARMDRRQLVIPETQTTLDTEPKKTKKKPAKKKPAKKAAAKKTEGAQAQT